MADWRKTRVNGAKKKRPNTSIPPLSSKNTAESNRREMSWDWKGAEKGHAEDQTSSDLSSRTKAFQGASSTLSAAASRSQKTTNVKRPGDHTGRGRPGDTGSKRQKTEGLLPRQGHERVYGDGGRSTALAAIPAKPFAYQSQRPPASTFLEEMDSKPNIATMPSTAPKPARKPAGMPFVIDSDDEDNDDEPQKASDMPPPPPAPKQTSRASAQVFKEEETEETPQQKAERLKMAAKLRQRNIERRENKKQGQGADAKPVAKEPPVSPLVSRSEKPIIAQQATGARKSTLGNINRHRLDEKSIPQTGGKTGATPSASTQPSHRRREKHRTTPSRSVIDLTSPTSSPTVPKPIRKRIEVQPNTILPSDREKTQRPEYPSQTASPSKEATLPDQVIKHESLSAEIGRHETELQSIISNNAAAARKAEQDRQKQAEAKKRADHLKRQEIQEANRKRDAEEQKRVQEERQKQANAEAAAAAQSAAQERLNEDLRRSEEARKKAEAKEQAARIAKEKADREAEQNRIAEQQRIAEQKRIAERERKVLSDKEREGKAERIRIKETHNARNRMRDSQDEDHDDDMVVERPPDQAKLFGLPTSQTPKSPAQATRELDDEELHLENETGIAAVPARNPDPKRGPVSLNSDAGQQAIQNFERRPLCQTSEPGSATPAHAAPERGHSRRLGEILQEDACLVRWRDLDGAKWDVIAARFQELTGVKRAHKTLRKRCRQIQEATASISPGLMKRLAEGNDEAKRDVNTKVHGRWPIPDTTIKSAQPDRRDSLIVARPDTPTNLRPLVVAKPTGATSESALTNDVQDLALDEAFRGTSREPADVEEAHPMTGGKTINNALLKLILSTTPEEAVAQAEADEDGDETESRPDPDNPANYVHYEYSVWRREFYIQDQEDGQEPDDTFADLIHGPFQSLQEANHRAAIEATQYYPNKPSFIDPRNYNVRSKEQANGLMHWWVEHPDVGRLDVAVKRRVVRSDEGILLASQANCVSKEHFHVMVRTKTTTVTMVPTKLTVPRADDMFGEELEMDVEVDVPHTTIEQHAGPLDRSQTLHLPSANRRAAEFFAEHTIPQRRNLTETGRVRRERVEDLLVGLGEDTCFEAEATSDDGETLEVWVEMTELYGPRNVL